MARRNRSILIDNTIGRIFTNSENTTTDPSKLIAGIKIRTSSISASRRVAVKIANNLGTGQGILFPETGLITSIDASVATAPTGNRININVKIGDTYETSTIVDSITIQPTSSSSTDGSNLNITVTAGDSVYFDITEVGSIKSGAGLSIKTSYY